MTFQQAAVEIGCNLLCIIVGVYLGVAGSDRFYRGFAPNTIGFLDWTPAHVAAFCSTFLLGPLFILTAVGVCILHSHVVYSLIALAANLVIAVAVNFRFVLRTSTLAS